MMHSYTRTTLVGLALALGMAWALAGCQAAPTKSSASSAASAPVPPIVLPPSPVIAQAPVTTNAAPKLRYIRPQMNAAQLRIAAQLDKRISSVNIQSAGVDLKNLFSVVSIATGVPIIVDDDVHGKVDFNIDGLTLRQLLVAACGQNDAFFYIHPAGYVHVRARIARIYPIDVLRAERKVTIGNAISMMASSNGGGNGYNNGYNGAGAMGSAASSNSSGAYGNSTSPGSSMTVETTNDDSFWTEFKQGIAALVGKGDTYYIDKTSGFLYLDAGLRTHARVEAFWRAAMTRMMRGVTVQVYVLDVEYNNANQFGIDYSAAPFRLGGVFNNDVRFGSPVTTAAGTIVEGLNSTLNTITSVGGNQLGTPTFTGTIGAGKFRAFISALETQGSVVESTAPSIGLLNNRSSVVQVSNDRNFFSVASNTIINDGVSAGSSISGVATPPVTRQQLVISQYSFGLMLPVTAQISDDGEITLDMSPSLTDFTGVDVGPDGSSAPRKTTHQFSTQVRLQNGEAYVMGGFVHSEVADQTNGTPGLSHLPGVLGDLFKNKAKTESRGELLIVVKATIKQADLPSPIEIYTPSPAQGGLTPDLDAVLEQTEQPQPAAAAGTQAPGSTDPVKANPKTPTRKGMIFDLGDGN